MGRSITLAFLAAVVWLVWYLTPVVSETLDCYRSHTPQFDEIEFRTRAYGWSEQKICEVKAETLVSLENCLVAIESKRNPKVLEKLKPYALQVVALLRYEQKNLKALKVEYNTLCDKFSDLAL